MTSKLFRWHKLPFALLAFVVLAACAVVAPAAPALASELDAPAVQSVEPLQAEANPSSAMQSDDSSLLHMREEEKLAHDVYVVLYERWGLPVFDNIAAAESQHMRMALQVLEAKGLVDPAAGNGPGEFTDAELQALYETLVARGTQSVVDALTVGATIEDLDIADLQAALATTTDSDVRWLFENLKRGSENHMRAFVRNLDRYGETYDPQYISSADYAAIVAGGNGTGGPGVRAGLRGFGTGRGGRWQR